MVICISRTQGSSGNDIGFELVDNLKIKYYDAEIFDQVLKRLEADKESVSDTEDFADFNKYDLCIHSANYGIKETMDVLKRMIAK